MKEWGKWAKFVTSGANGFIGNLQISQRIWDIVLDTLGDVDIKVDLRNANQEKNIVLMITLQWLHLGAKISVSESFEKPNYTEKSMSMLLEGSYVCRRPRMLQALQYMGKVEGG